MIVVIFRNLTKVTISSTKFKFESAVYVVQKMPYLPCKSSLI